MIFPIKLGQWLPDKADFRNPGCEVAKNVYPVSSGFGPFESPAGTGDTTTEVVNGAELFVKADNTPLICGGSATKLFVRDSSITETTGYTALDADHIWRFERFNDMVIAVTPNNAPQYLTDLNSDTSWSALSGSPPKASVIGRVNDFLVMGDLTDIDSSVVPYRVRWSALNNPNGNWVTDRGEMSDYRDLDPKFGRITAIVGGRFGLIFQERAIWRMTFIGSPQVFSFDEVSVDRGCAAPDSVVNIGLMAYFLSQDGFYVTDGSSVEPIDAGRVSSWFVNEVKQSEIDRVQGALHWPKKCVIWSFIPSDGSGFSRQIIYSFSEDAWSYSDEVVHYFAKTKVDATTIGDLATLYPAGIGTVGVIGNPEWESSSYTLGAFIENGAGSEFATMSGPARAATIETGDFQVIEGSRAHVSGIQPVVENTTGNTTTQVLSRSRQGDVQSVSSATVEGADGFCPHKVDARYIAARMSIPAGNVWGNATGVNIRARKSGAR